MGLKMKDAPWPAQNRRVSSTTKFAKYSREQFGSEADCEVYTNDEIEGQQQHFHPVNPKKPKTKPCVTYDQMQKWTLYEMSLSLI